MIQKTKWFIVKTVVKYIQYRERKAECPSCGERRHRVDSMYFCNNPGCDGGIQLEGKQ
jgi:hypothetical protein